MSYPLEIIKKAAIDGVLEWKAENTEEHIKQRVLKQLDDIEEESVLVLLGFTKNWGRIEIASKEDSPIRKHIIKIKEDCIKEFFDSLDIKTLFSPAIKKQIIREAKHAITSSLHSSVRSMVLKHCNQLAEEVVSEILPKIDMSKELALFKLIGTDNESHN